MIIAVCPSPFTDSTATSVPHDVGTYTANVYDKNNSIYNKIDSLKNIMFFKYNESAYEDLCFENIDFIYDNIDILSSVPISFSTNITNDNIIKNHKNDLLELDKFINLKNPIDVLIFEIKRFKHLKDSLNISKINLWEKNLLKSFIIGFVNIENYNNFNITITNRNYSILYIFQSFFKNKNKRKRYKIRSKYKIQRIRC